MWWSNTLHHLDLHHAGGGRGGYFLAPGVLSTTFTDTATARPSSVLVAWDC